MNFEDYKKELLNKNTEVKEQYDNLSLEYEIKSQIIKARLEKGLTQKQLADILGIPQSHISRLESGKYNPSVKYLEKVPESLGETLKITLV